MRARYPLRQRGNRSIDSVPAIMRSLLGRAVSLDASLEKMRAAGLPEAALKTFVDYYERLRGGDEGLLRRAGSSRSPSSPIFAICPTMQGARARPSTKPSS